MKKIALISLVVTGSLFAGEGFVGVDVGSAKITGKITATAGSTTLSATGDTTGGTQALKIGYYLNDNNRVYASIHRFNESTNVHVSEYKASYDYLIGTGDLKPFIGASIGTFSYKESGLGTLLVKDSLDASGMAYGAQVGLQYKINKNIDAEFSYVYLKTNGSETTTYTGHPTWTAKLEGDKVSSWQFGLNYRF